MSYTILQNKLLPRGKCIRCFKTPEEAIAQVDETTQRIFTVEDPIVTDPITLFAEIDRLTILGRYVSCQKG